MLSLSSQKNKLRMNDVYVTIMWESVLDSNFWQLSMNIFQVSKKLELSTRIMESSIWAYFEGRNSGKLLCYLPTDMSY